jgi:hypothetical protein
MLREEIKIGDEISRDIKDTYDRLTGADRLLTEIYIELRLLRKLTELQVLKSNRLRKAYEHEKIQIKSTLTNLERFSETLP